MKTFKQKPIDVVGTILKIGDTAKDFSVVNRKLETVKLSDFNSKYVVINVVPSLDTGVCSIQTHKINETLNNFKDLTVLTISNDLPFAQARWCGAEGLDQIVVLSDYQTLDFANKFGVNILGLRLLARSVFVLNEKREVIYLEYLDEMSNHPNYEALFSFLNDTVK